MPDNDPAMSDPQRLAAFADGELTGAENLRLLEQARTDPQVAASVRHHQQLRQACQRVMAERGTCPDSVRQRISALRLEDVEEPDRPEDSSVIGRIGRWAPALVAAVLLLGAVMLYQDALRGPDWRPLDEAILPVAQAEAFSTRHDTCSQSIDQLRNLTRYACELQGVSKTICDKLGSAVPTLDLTPLGYTYQGAGDCILPGRDSVHLIYKPVPGSGHSDSVSLWVCADQEDLAIDPGRLYVRQCPTSGRQLLVWRRGGIIYYLLGDDPTRIETIARDLSHQPLG